VNGSSDSRFGKLVRPTTIVGAITICSILIVAMPLFKAVNDVRRRGRAAEALVGPMEQLRSRAPADRSRERWSMAVGLTASCAYNALQADDVSPSEAERIVADFQRRLDGPPAEAFHWLWHEIEQSGPHGRSFARRNKPFVLEALGAKVAR
jgi:hypothetical protein